MTPGSQNKGTFYILFLRKMKKFSFLLFGAFLLWTITFALAEDAKEVETDTWTTVEAKAEESVTTTEVTAEITATEVATWDTAEVTEERTTTETTEVVEAAEEAAPTISDAAKEKYGEEQIAAY